MTKSIQLKFSEAIQSGARVFGHDRTKTLGASETFACIRKGWFAKHHPEYAADAPKNWGILERGNLIENHFAVPNLRKIFGEENCLYMGGDQETFFIDKSSVTPDGLVLNQPRDIFAADGLPDIEADCFMTEIKSFDPRMNLREEKFIHRGQTQMQLGHVRELTEYKPVHSALFYINASDLTDIRPFFIRFDPVVYEQGKTRADKIYSTKDVTKLFPEGKHTDQCRYCPFTKHCNGADLRVFPTHKSNYGDNQIKMMRSLAQEYDAASQKEKEGKKEKGEVGDKIRAALVEMNSKGIEADDYKVTYSKIGGKTSTDEEALEAFLKSHGKTLSDFDKKGDDFTRLTVTIRESGGVDLGETTI